MRTVLIFGLIAGAVSIARAAGAPPDLDVIVTYETRQTLPSGVTRTESWQERLIRRSDTVWTERVLADANGSTKAHAGHSHASQAVAQAKSAGQLERPHHSHKHFNYDTASRWVTRRHSGELQLRYVDSQQKLTVTVPNTEFSSVGFDGRWETTAHIVPPALVVKMPMQKLRQPTPAGAAWRVEKTADWSHQVLWSDRMQIAMRVISERGDGRMSRSITLELAPPRRSLPWASADSYTQKSYEDFLD